MKAFKQISEYDGKEHWHFRIGGLHIEYDDDGLRYVDLHLPNFWFLFGVSRFIICIGIQLKDYYKEIVVGR